MLPNVGSTILFYWGRELVRAEVEQIESPSRIKVLEATDHVFGGSAYAWNINFHYQNWCYDND
jgi:hypothetical protein